MNNNLYNTYSGGFYYKNFNQNTWEMASAKKYLGFNDIENLKVLPISQNDHQVDINVEWISLSNLYDFYIFPKKFKPEHFDQGNTGLCFFFSCLASIAGVPGLIHQLFGNINNWKKTKQFIVYLFYNNERKEISINDKFPFYKMNYYNDKIPWIWSIPADKELFAKILEKAYIKYQMIYGTYGKKYSKISEEQKLLEEIYHIVYDGGLERNAMKILINSRESKKIYNCGVNNINNSDQIFQDIKYYLENKKGLVTLGRKFDNDNYSGHAYSVIGAWKFGQGKNMKNVLCIKNPWDQGNNKQEKFNLDSLNNSLKNFPELINFNNKYFDPSRNIQAKSQLDYSVNNNSTNGISSVFVAPIDYLIKNGLMSIEAHIPNYEKDFPNVNLELDLYKKLDKLFIKIQANNTKNVFDSRVDGMSTVTRVISIGDDNTREIMSDIYNKNLFKITKNGKSYCQIERRPNGEYNINNFSKIFENDYLDNNCILVNNITGQKKVITLDYLINSDFKGDGMHDLLTFQHYPRIMPQANRCIGIKMNDFNNIKIDQTEKNERNDSDRYKEKEPLLLIDEIKPRYFRNFKIEKEEKPEYIRIEYNCGYYRGWVLKNKRHGIGKFFYNDGDFEDGEWFNNNFIKGTVKITYDNGDYYIGSYSYGKRNGNGKYYYKGGDYEDGFFSNDDLENGSVRLHYDNGYYIGKMSNNEKNGYGEYYYNDGDYYKGTYLNDKKDGYGEERINGTIYKGNYDNGLKNGKFKVIKNRNVDYVEYEYGKKKSSCIFF